MSVVYLLAARAGVTIMLLIMMTIRIPLLFLSELIVMKQGMVMI
ncbi:MAG: hypothetical protein PHD07_06910 [Bacteroidales bacterium]|nr:hypothetical protein [Bacteroidales bacterium]